MAQAMVEAAVNGLELEKQGTKSRFLTSRTKKSLDNGYHPTHQKDAHADLPEIEEYGLAVAHEEKDREVATISPSKYQLTDEDAATLKQEITHLPFETILKIFAFYHHNVQITIAAAQQMRIPQLLPEKVQEMFVANIAIEREHNPSKKLLYKSFYMADSFRKVANNKTLVSFYYSEKNKIEGNWRLELEDQQPMESEERIALEQKMAAAGLQVARRDNSIQRKKGKKNHQKTQPRSDSANQRGEGTSNSGLEIHTEPADPPVASTCTIATSPIPMETEYFGIDQTCQAVVPVKTIATSPIPMETEASRIDQAIQAVVSVVSTGTLAIPVKGVNVSCSTSVEMKSTGSLTIPVKPRDAGIDQAVQAVTSSSTTGTMTLPMKKRKHKRETECQAEVEKRPKVTSQIPMESEDSRINQTTTDTLTEGIPVEVASIESATGCTSPIRNSLITVEAQTPTKVAATTSMSTSQMSRKVETPSVTALSTPEPKSSASTSSITTTSSETSTVAPADPSPPLMNLKIRFRDLINRRQIDPAICASSPIFSYAPPPTSTSYDTAPSSSSSSVTPTSNSSFSSSSLSSSNATGEKKIKKKYRKKTIEELRGGIQKTYPDRERKAKRFFEEDS